MINVVIINKNNNIVKIEKNVVINNYNVFLVVFFIDLFDVNIDRKLFKKLNVNTTFFQFN